MALCSLSLWFFKFGYISGTDRSPGGTKQFVDESCWEQDDLHLHLHVIWSVKSLDIARTVTINKISK